MEDNKTDANEKMSESAYRKVIRDSIMQYVRSNPAENCTRKNLLAHVAGDNEVQKARKKRYQSKKSKDDAYGENPNKKRYELMFGIALNELIEAKKLERLKVEKKHPRYVLSSSEAKIYSLCNNEIAVFEVGEGREKLVKKKIEEVIEDKKIAIIPVNGFLLCTMRNPKNFQGEVSQLEYIRTHVENAIIDAYGKFYVEDTNENNR